MNVLITNIGRRGYSVSYTHLEDEKPDPWT